MIGRPTIMVLFRDTPTSSKKSCLVLLDRKNQDLEDGTALPTFSPGIGPSSPSLPPHDKSFLLDFWSLEIRTEAYDQVSKEKKKTNALVLQSPLHSSKGSLEVLPLLRKRIMEGKFS